jgi:hypothetical protein
LRYATGIDNPDNCGENHIVYEDTNTLYSTDYATTVWYDEIRFYDFKWPGLKLTTSHFTQVVWKNSRTFGCGIAGEVVVCMYCPAGNGKGRGTFKDNVMPLDPRNRDGVRAIQNCDVKKPKEVKVVDKNYCQRSLIEHNRYRAMHKACPLECDKDLIDSA